MMSPAIALVFLLLSPCVYARLDTRMPVIRQVRLPGAEVQKAAYSHVALGRTVFAQFRPRRDTDFTTSFPLARGVSTLPSSSARR